jgi:hypothetical protein
MLHETFSDLGIPRQRVFHEIDAAIELSIEFLAKSIFTIQRMQFGSIFNSAVTDCVCLGASRKFSYAFPIPSPTRATQWGGPQSRYNSRDESVVTKPISTCEKYQNW